MSLPQTSHTMRWLKYVCIYVYIYIRVISCFWKQAEEGSKFIRAESAVLRLGTHIHYIHWNIYANIFIHTCTYIHTYTGRKNASTDHSSVIFNVNTATGEIEDGTSNAHWFVSHPCIYVCMYVCMRKRHVEWMCEGTSLARSKRCDARGYRRKPLLSVTRIVPTRTVCACMYVCEYVYMYECRE